MSIETMKLALEALENSETLINGTDDSFGLAGAMDGYYSDCFDLEKNEKLMNQAIITLRQAIEQAEKPEPVATMWQHGETGRTRITTPDSITDCDARWFKVSDLYTSPPPRQPLTDEEIIEMHTETTGWLGCPSGIFKFARAIEAAHGIKENT